MTSTVYMFHSIGKLDINDSADPHYNFSEEKFIEFLKSVGSVGSIFGIKEQKMLGAPVVTFDDGHQSNYLAALSMLDKSLGFGDFFINPSMVGKKDFMDWNQLREIAELGMSIQSHSLDHIYLSDCNSDEQKYQLQKSKAIIEDKIGKEVVILAPPGGRYNRQTIDIAKSLGYHTITNSKPGVWENLDQYLIPRIPVTVNDQVDNLSECNEPNSRNISRLKRKYQITGLAKKALGNKVYDGLRERLLGANV
jgi:peptidoglycan/xylan/chitin deacetylase (PgdA/CDA1 family)